MGWALSFARHVSHIIGLYANTLILVGYCLLLGRLVCSCKISSFFLIVGFVGCNFIFVFLGYCTQLSMKWMNFMQCHHLNASILAGVNKAYIFSAQGE